MIPLAPQLADLVTVISQLAELPPIATYLVLGYLLIQQIVPLLLIVLAMHRATPAQRIGLVRDYLTRRRARPRHRSDNSNATDRPR